MNPKTLLTASLAGFTSFAQVLDLSEAHYISHRISYVYHYDEEQWPERETLGYIESKWRTTDLLMQGRFAPGASWEIPSEEWNVTLALTDGPWRTDSQGETFYGFNLTLERVDGSWSHTWLHLGAWSERPSYVPYGDVILGADSTIGEPFIWEADGFEEPRATHVTRPDFVPWDVQNGGTIDTGLDTFGSYLYNTQYVFEDVPVGEDQWMAFSLGVGFNEQGDILARIGIADELSRTAIANVPEPSTWMLCVLGLAWLTLLSGPPTRKRTDPKARCT